MDLQQLQYFLMAMRCGSFSEAARRGYTTQPNISKNISSLEKQLGYQLFIRTRNGIIPTPEAIVLEKKLSVLLAQFNQVMASSAGGSVEVPEYLQVGFCENMSLVSVAPDFFQNFLEIEELNNVHVQLHCYTPQRVIAEIIQRKLDLAFVYSTYPVTATEVSVLPLTRFKPRLYYSTRHPLAAAENISVASFEGAKFVKLRDSQYNALADLPYTPEDVLLVDTLSDINLYLETGTCVTVLGPSQNIADRPGMRYLEISSSPRTVGANAIWRKDNENPAMIRTLPYLLKRAE